MVVGQTGDSCSVNNPEARRGYQDNVGVKIVVKIGRLICGLVVGASNQNEYTSFLELTITTVFTIVITAEYGDSASPIGATAGSTTRDFSTCLRCESMWMSSNSWICSKKMCVRSCSVRRHRARHEFLSSHERKSGKQSRGAHVSHLLFRFVRGGIEHGLRSHKSLNSEGRRQERGGREFIPAR